MRLTSAPVVGIEITGKRLVAVQVDPSTEPPVLRRTISVELPGPPGPDTLKAALAGLRGATAHLALSDVNATHRVTQLPPMSEAERQQFLARELGREIGPGLLIGHRVLRALEGTPRKEEVLVVAAPGEEGNQILAALAAARLSPRLVTTAPLALARAAAMLAPDAFDERPTAIAHWGGRGLSVMVLGEGLLKFTREIPHLAVPGLDPAEWFATEFQRSIRQYLQTVKGGAVGRVLLSSVDARFEAAFGTLEARLGVPVVDLNEAVRALLPEDAEETPELTVGAFIVPLGAALLSPAATANLLPPAIRRREQAVLLGRGTAAAAALVLLVVGYGTWATMQEAARYRRSVARVNAERQSQQAAEARTQQIKQERELQYQRIRLLKSDPVGSPPLAEIFKEISRVSPDDLRLERLAVGHDAGAITLRMSGRVESPDLAQAQAEFNRFYFGLQRSPFVAEVVLNPPAPTRATVQQSGSPVVEGRTARDLQRTDGQTQEALASRGKKLVFELELRLRGMK